MLHGGNLFGKDLKKNYTKQLIENRVATQRSQVSVAICRPQFLNFLYGKLYFKKSTGDLRVKTLTYSFCM